jgi:glucoamylase
MESFAGPGLMMPEQIWDGAELPARGLAFGRANGSSSPLGWAHAEYLQLLAMVALSGFPDVVLPARRRYTEVPPHDPAFVWSHKHQITRLLAGRRFKVQLPRPGSVHFTADNWATHGDVEAIDTTLGVWVAEVPSHKAAAGSTFQWTAHYSTGWEGRNYSVTVI